MSVLLNYLTDYMSGACVFTTLVTPSHRREQSAQVSTDEIAILRRFAWLSSFAPTRSRTEQNFFPKSKYSAPCGSSALGEWPEVSHCGGWRSGSQGLPQPAEQWPVASRSGACTTVLSLPCPARPDQTRTLMSVILTSSQLHRDCVCFTVTAC